MHGPHLLYIEDDPANRELVTHALELAGMRVHAAKTGEEGREAIQHCEFDLVITDYRLPWCNGLEVVQSVVGDHPHLPVIMLSGSGDLNVAVRAMKLGASDYLIKDNENLYLDLLLSVVSRLLDSQRLLQEAAKLQATLDRERHWSGLAIDRIHQGIAVFDAELRLQLWNRRFLEICAFPAEFGSENTSLEAFIRYGATRGDYGDETSEADILRRIARAREPGSFRYERQIGAARVEVSRESLPGGGFVVTYTDVSDRWSAEQRVRYHAYHDALTGLPNRMLFQELMQHELSLARRNDTCFALLFLDLDGFKAVNDCLGHMAGDQLLIEASQRLRREIRESDVVARQGGDEFLALLLGADTARASAIAHDLVAILSEPFQLNEGVANVSASIGIAIFPDAGVSEDMLLRAADEAMYRAKAAGKGGYCIA